LVNLSRNIFFYQNIGLKDKLETRILLIFLHLSIILIVNKIKSKVKFPQKIYDNVFMNIEYHMREIGHGDVTVNKEMKNLNKIFYDILLKINKSKKDKFTPNQIVVKKYFNDQNLLNNEKLSKMLNYLDTFYNYCFELDLKIMIKGDLKFKY
tara:strand:+ start:507 stop:962 length:456 start_codon:yes stop_codon:yes gene_type:complete